MTVPSVQAMEDYGEQVTTAKPASAFFPREACSRGCSHQVGQRRDNWPMVAGRLLALTQCPPSWLRPPSNRLWWEERSGCLCGCWRVAGRAVKGSGRAMRYRSKRLGKKLWVNKRSGELWDNCASCSHPWGGALGGHRNETFCSGSCAW